MPEKLPGVANRGPSRRESGQAVRDAVLKRLANLGQPVEPLPRLRDCWRVGGVVCYLRYSSALS